MPKIFCFSDPAEEKSYGVYLNLSLPYVRWNTALGIIYPASFEPEKRALHFSMFASQRFRKGIDYFNFEMELEEERVRKFPHKVSRLQGLFVFETQEEAKKAEMLWGDSTNHFQPDCLTEATCEIGHNKSKHDSNWITYYLQKGSPEHPSNWKELYWENAPYPHQNPVWETIVDKPLLLLNEDLRQSVYDRLDQELPCSFNLRLSICASNLGYELGRLTITLLQVNECLQVRHIIRFDEDLAVEVIEAIKREKPEYMSQLWRKEKDTFCIAPDLRSSDFCLTHQCPPQECP